MRNKLLLITAAILSTIIMFTFILNKTYSIDNQLGDVNNDGVVNKTDAILIAKYIIDGKESLNSTFIEDQADVNKDGKIKMNDSMAIVLNDNEVPVESVSLSVAHYNVKNGNSITIAPTVLPNNASDKSVTWTSSNEDIATVDSSGKVTTKKQGVVTITATTNNNKTANVNLTVNKYNVEDSFEGTKLKYYIERAADNYIVTRIWVQDPYNQVRVAMNKVMTTAPGKTIGDRCFQESKTGNFTIYEPSTGQTILNNEISKKGYSNKALVAINASSMVSDDFNTEAPCSWYGTAGIHYLVNNGTVIRNSTNDDSGRSLNVINGIDKNGNLRGYVLKQGVTEEEKEFNRTKVNSIADAQIKYTFGFGREIVYNYEAVNDHTEKNIRQVLCQINKNNFIILSSTVSDTNQTTRDEKGLSYGFMATELVTYGCKLAYNLDGGGSQFFHYKKNNSTINKKGDSYNGRLLADILYFVDE